MKEQIANRMLLTQLVLAVDVGTALHAAFTHPVLE